MPDLAPVAAKHHPLHRLRDAGGPRSRSRTSMFRRLGNMLGTADIIAQMADRCYLEKCRDRLYPEFVAGGLAYRRPARSRPATCVFSSPEDLLCKTPASTRSRQASGSTICWAAPTVTREAHFGGQNLYLDEVMKNIQHAERVAEKGDVCRCCGATAPARAVRRCARVQWNAASAADRRSGCTRSESALRLQVLSFDSPARSCPRARCDSISACASDASASGKVR